MNSDLYERIYEDTMTLLREKYYREDNATAIPRNDFHWTYYKMIVEKCAQSVEHIHVWDGNLGDHIRSKMGTL